MVQVPTHVVTAIAAFCFTCLIMESEYKRLLSFHVSSFPGSPLWFAEAGFYLKDDLIQCAFCPYFIPYFPQREDFCLDPSILNDPFRCHIEGNPDCPFVTFQEDCPNVPFKEHAIHPLQTNNTRLEYVRLKTFSKAPFLYSKQCEMFVGSGLYYDDASNILDCKIKCSFCPFSASLYDGRDLFSSSMVQAMELFHRHAVFFVTECPLLKILCTQGTMACSEQGRRLHMSQHKQENQSIGNVLLPDTDSASRPKFPQKEDANARYFTFLDDKWPFQPNETRNYVNLSIEEFTRCGFCYMGYADYVVCYWCGVILGDWHPEHSVRDNHLKCSGQCPVAIQTRTCVPIPSATRAAPCNASATNVRVSTPTVMVPSLTVTPTVVHMLPSRTPVVTPKGLEATPKVKGPKPLASVTPTGTWKPIAGCSRSNASKDVTRTGTMTVREVIIMDEEMEEEPRITLTAAGARSTEKDRTVAGGPKRTPAKNRRTVPANSGVECVDPTEQEEAHFEKGMTCVICMEKNRTVVFQNCRHFMCCENCADKVKRCPCCREIITKKLLVFF